MPEDVTLNLSKDAPIPPVPIEGHKWGKVIYLLYRISLFLNINCILDRP
jgi:hypothetical protein